MIHENIELTGSFNISGSFVLPNHVNTASLVEETGSMYHDQVDGVLKIYTGTQWVVVGDQSGSAAAAAPTNLEYLLIAGGAGGAIQHGGGGGAGGYLSSSLNSVTSGSSFTVTVGGAGAGGIYSSGNASGTDGVDSIIAGMGVTVTAAGGGGGSSYATQTVPGNGGSGGGGGNQTSGTQSGGSGTAGQGNNGGDGSNSSTNYPSGGGGGAGAVGGNASAGVGGNGGIGKRSKITGTLTYYAGGGGSATYQGGTPGTGGQGGGATGISAGSTNGNNATTNTGGGGSGGNGGSGYYGGSGGAGVAIFAYPTGSINGVGGLTGTTSSGNKYHQFNSSGTLTLGGASDLQIVTGNNLQLHLDAGNFASRGTSTWTDLSGNGNNGTVNGATLTGTHYTFDGSNDSVTLAEGDVSNTTPHSVYGTFTGASETNWTLECWFKTSEDDDDAHGTPIIGRDNGDLFAQLTVKDNKVHYLHANPSWLYVTSTSNVTDDTWHHVVLVNYSNATMDLWLDGVKEVTAANSTIYYSVDTRYFKVSHVARGYLGDYTACEVAQIRLYDKDLSDAEVLQNYNATKHNFV
jgi:hypothetical protein